MLLLPYKFKWLFTILLLPVFCSSQNSSSTIDSLINEINRHKNEDTLLVDLYNDLAYAYYRVDPEKGLEISDKAILLSKKLNNDFRIAASYSKRALNYTTLGDDSLAIVLYQEALGIYTKLKSPMNIAITQHNIGLIYNGQSDYFSAIRFHQQAYDVLRNLKDSARMLHPQNSVGVNYMAIADYPKALQSFFDVLLIAERIKNIPAVANACTNIGIIYKNMGDFDKSLSYHERAYKIFDEAGDKLGVANSLGNMGIVMDSKNQYTDALNYFYKALKIGYESGNKRIIASNHTNIASTYFNQGKTDSALANFQKAEKMYEYLKDRNNLASVLTQIGSIYASQKKFDLAVQIQNKALSYAVETGALDNQSQIWENLFTTYKQRGDFRNALDALEKHFIIRDSIFSEEKIQELSRKEAEFEGEKKTAVLKATHEAEIKQQKTVRNFLIGGSVFLIATGGLLFGSYKRRRDAEQQVQTAEIQNKVLRLQMNPHFIFNSLNSISDYIRRNDIAHADEYLTNFAKVMRMTLENSEKTEIPIEDDLNALELYMQLEAKRLNNKFTYKISVANDIDQGNTIVPPMLIQPFVENSIWHGFANIQGGGHININIRKENNKLFCSIDDNGVGRLKSAITSPASDKKSLGMKITRERIHLLKKKKGNNVLINLIDKEEGFLAELVLPLETTF